MSSLGPSRQDLAAQNAGLYRTRIWVYQPAQGVSSTGGVIRNPTGAGLGIGASPPGNPLWVDYAALNTTTPTDKALAGRPASVSQTEIEVRWGRNKPYVPGMGIYIPGSGQLYIIEGIEIVLVAFKKLQLNCRSVV